MSTNEKAVEVLDTPATAQENVHRDSTQKRLATLQARAALAGFAVRRVVDRDGAACYLVTRGFTHQSDSLDALERWLDLVAGGRP